ncbi:pilus assembly protein HofM [Ewingella americana]
MQHSLPFPDARLSGAARSAFILASGAKHFPLSVEQLVMDYRAAPMDAQNIIVTAARREEMQQWQRFLAESHLVPEVVELAPCALQLAASCAGESSDKLLLHRLDEGWLWVSPHGLPFQFGVFDAQEVKDISQLASLAKEQYRAVKLCDEEMLFSSSRVEELPLGVGAWSPFRALTQLSPPLPANPAAFALAMGLALRARDS